MSHFLQNLNSNRLVSVDCETTGTIAGYHDIVQLAVIVLDGDLKPDRTVLPFAIDITPRHPERADSEAMRINRLKLCDISTNGLDPDVASELFVEYVSRLNLGFRKRLIPIGCNYSFDHCFIKEWLGPSTYETIFDSAAVRDVLTIAHYVNDRDGLCGRDFSYPRVSLQGLCSALNIERTQAHEALDDARVTAECYRALLYKFS